MQIAIIEIKQNFKFCTRHAVQTNLLNITNMQVRYYYFYFKDKKQRF